jgi:hypothetical protein
MVEEKTRFRVDVLHAAQLLRRQVHASRGIETATVRPDALRVMLTEVREETEYIQAWRVFLTFSDDSWRK